MSTFQELPEMFRRYSSQYPMLLTTGGRMIEGFHDTRSKCPPSERSTLIQPESRRGATCHYSALSV